MLIKSRKLINFSTRGDKNKKAKQESHRVKTQTRPGSWKTSRLQQVTLNSTLQKKFLKKNLPRGIIPRYRR